MPRHINDALLQNAVRSYLNQIHAQCQSEGATDIGAIVILARPGGDGEFVVHGAGVIDGHQMDGATQRKILKALHNETSMISMAPTVKS
jgi:hypothetical protein